MSETKIEKVLFGTMPDGRDVFNYTLYDSKGQSVTVSEYACAITSIKVLNKFNKLIDVCLGYDTLDGYLNDKCCFGALVGRYANRIKGASFNLNGVTYKLEANNGNNTLHGGAKSLRRQIFKSQIQGNKVIFTRTSPDLELGFPGNFTVNNAISFEDGELRMDLSYISDKDTPVSITNHCYFNLNGHDCGQDILSHELKINANKYCEYDDELVAMAPALPVENTRFDFRDFRVINQGGYDHCFEVNHDGSQLAAAAQSDLSGIKLEVYSDMPAVQFYTGNSIGSVTGKENVIYKNYSGFALECQQFPNAVNEPRFPSPIIKANTPCSCFIAYKFI
ncbi:MAG: galactose mutarotase [Synergistaceae bacterium]|nr:galactose mutarotase [Synergistaceae bacterium]